MPRTTNGQPGYSCLTNSWHSSSSRQQSHTMAAGDDDPLALCYYDNGRIRAADARWHNFVPVLRGRKRDKRRTRSKCLNPALLPVCNSIPEKPTTLEAF